MSEQGGVDVKQEGISRRRFVIGLPIVAAFAAGTGPNCPQWPTPSSMLPTYPFRVASIPFINSEQLLEM
jgi:hypothetical protein